MQHSSICLAVAQIEPRAESLRDSVAAHRCMAEEAARCGAHFVLFPELSITGYDRALESSDAVDPTSSELAPIAEVSRRRGIVVSVGAPVASPDGLLIAALSFLPDGHVSVYTKQHLHSGEEAAFAAGTGGPLLPLDARRQVGLAICAEINRPAHVEQTIARGADVYAASCFLTPNGYDSDCVKLQEYSQRYAVPVLLANFAGPSGGFASAGRSAIWDERGRLVARAPSSKEHLVLATRADGEWSASVQPVSISLP